MRIGFASVASLGCRFAKTLAATIAVLTLGASSALAQSSSEVGGEASLKLPDLSAGDISRDRWPPTAARSEFSSAFSDLGFGLAIYMRLKNLPVHRAMREISELIYETCKTYLVTQGKFLLLLWVFIAVVIVLYFGCSHPCRGSRSRSPCPSFSCSAWWESREATGWRGLASG